MTMPRAGGFVPPGPTGLIAPASWWEWIFSIYHPDKYELPVRSRNVQIAIGANTNNNGQIQVIDPAFAYMVRSRGWVTGTGAAPAFPYRLGFGQASADDWFGGVDVLTASANNSGDDIGVGKLDHVFPFPRELEQGTQLNAVVQNLSATPITVDVALWYIFVRERRNKIVRNVDGSPNWSKGG
jgi:hypothetical protein